MRETIIQYELEASTGGGEWRLVKSFDDKYEAQQTLEECRVFFDETYRLVKRVYHFAGEKVLKEDTNTTRKE